MTALDLARKASAVGTHLRVRSVGSTPAAVVKSRRSVDQTSASNMTAHPDNAVFAAINRIAKQKYHLGLGDWLAASSEQRTAMDAWCVQHNYELVIDASDLGNDHVRLGGVGHDERQEHEDRSQDYSEAGGMK